MSPLSIVIITTKVIHDFSLRYNHLMFADYREPLVEVAAQLLVVLLDHETMQQASAVMNGTDVENPFEVRCKCKLFMTV